MLIGLVHCSHCGSMMTHNSAVKKGKTYLYYQCTKVGHSDKSACPIRRVSAKALESLVLERLRFLSGRKDLVEKITALSVRMARKRIPKLRDERNRLLGQLQAIEKDAARLVKAMSKNKMSIIQDKLLVLDGQRESLKAKIAEIDEESAKEKGKIVDPEIVCQNLQYFGDIFEVLPFEKQRDLVHLLIKKITYYKDPKQLSVELYNVPEIKKPPRGSGLTHRGGSSLSSRFDVRMYWLPGQDSNLGHVRYTGPLFSQWSGLYHNPVFTGPRALPGLQTS